MKKYLIRFSIFLYLVAGFSSLKAQSEQPYEVTESEIVYKTINGRNLKMLIYEPKIDSNANLPAIVFFHGGGWNVGSYKLFQHHTRYFASRGMVAFSPQYRIGTMVPGTTVDQCLMDAKSAMRYIKTHAATYDINPDKIVASGASAGGLLAGGLAIIDEFNESTDNLTVSPQPCAVVLYFPAICIDESFLNDAYRERFNGLEENLSCCHQVKSDGLPPFLIMSGDADKQTPIEGMRLFDAKMKEFENDSNLIEYPKQGHGFMILDHSVKYFIATLKETEVFLEKHVQLKGNSWVEEYVVSLGYAI
ncbi:MAG: alpha/beta hydrolase [Dysgonomonas sp.]